MHETESEASDSSVGVCPLYPFPKCFSESLFDFWKCCLVFRSDTVKVLFICSSTFCFVLSIILFFSFFFCILDVIWRLYSSISDFALCPSVIFSVYFLFVPIKNTICFLSPEVPAVFGIHTPRNVPPNNSQGQNFSISPAHPLFSSKNQPFWPFPHPFRPLFCSSAVVLSPPG